MMKRWIIAIAAAAAMPVAFAQDTGNLIVRARAVNLDSANGGSTTPDLDLSVNNKVIPEVDFTWFFSPNFAAELILTYPQKHDLKAAGTKIGTLKHLPPTLTAQYHFTGLNGWRPYVGAGLNVTLFSNVNIDVAGADIKKSSVGLALQAGADVPIGGGWLINVDVKKVQIKTDVKLNGNKIGDFKVDPLLFGIGVGKRF
jgi:outer membrane protein